MLYKSKRGLPKQSLLISGSMSTILRRNTFISVCGKRTVRPSGVEFCPCCPLRVLFRVVFLPVVSGSWAADCLCQHWVHAFYPSLHTTVQSGYLFIHEKNGRAIFRAPRRVKEHFLTSIYVLSMARHNCVPVSYSEPEEEEHGFTNKLTLPHKLPCGERLVYINSKRYNEEIVAGGKKNQE